MDEAGSGRALAGGNGLSTCGSEDVDVGGGAILASGASPDRVVSPSTGLAGLVGIGDGGLVCGRRSPVRGFSRGDLECVSGFGKFVRFDEARLDAREECLLVRPGSITTVSATLSEVTVPCLVITLGAAELSAYLRGILLLADRSRAVPERRV